MRRTVTNPKIFEGWTPEHMRLIGPAEALRGKEFVLQRRNGNPVVHGVPREIVYHSPDGFEWGYGGSGPADLALNVLVMLVPPAEAWRLHHPFKFEWLATRKRDATHTIAFDDVIEWIEAQWAKTEAPKD